MKQHPPVHFRNPFGPIHFPDLTPAPNEKVFKETRILMSSPCERSGSTMHSHGGSSLCRCTCREGGLVHLVSVAPEEEHHWIQCQCRRCSPDPEYQCQIRILDVMVVFRALLSGDWTPLCEDCEECVPPSNTRARDASENSRRELRHAAKRRRPQ